MEKSQILKNANFGSQIAEEELGQLIRYFVETEQWRKFYSGECDIVFGPKGSGKSALYSLLTSKKEEFRLGKRTIFLQAENPRGTPAFSVLEKMTGNEKIADEYFRSLWKLYFLSILADYIRHAMTTTSSINKECSEVIELLANNELLDKGMNLVTRLKAAWSYIRKILPSSIEGGFIDPNSGVKVSGKITLGEPTREQTKQGYISVDALLLKLNIGFAKLTITAWIVLDRLDVAFADNDVLEAAAIKSLFRVYLDMINLSQFKVKIFLRDDIWKKVVDGGFREASHIIRTINIEWDEQSLLNLIANRLVSNVDLCTYYNLDPALVMKDFALQEKIFLMFFPNQMGTSTKKQKTINWMLTRLTDGTNRTAPREVIHFLNSARELQLEHYRLGKKLPDDKCLIDKSALRDALPKVSTTRYQQTLCAEHPTLIKYLKKLEGEKAEQNLNTLSKLWEMSEKETMLICEKLVDTGFFARRGSKTEPVFWVPYLYRSALNLVQGSAAKKNGKTKLPLKVVGQLKSPVGDE